MQLCKNIINNHFEFTEWTTFSDSELLFIDDFGWSSADIITEEIQVCYGRHNISTPIREFIKNSS